MLKVSQIYLCKTKKTSNFRDIQLKSVNNTLLFDIYYKPTSSFNYLTYSPSPIKNNIALSLAKGIINIVSNNREKRLKELIFKRNHPLKIIDYLFTKWFQPKLDKDEDLENIIFTGILNPSHGIYLNKLNRSL